MLSGDRLITYLRTCNKTLADKAKNYQRKYEDMESMLYEKEAECAGKIRKIRSFYRDLLYYSNNRSAVMVKLALAKKT